MEIQFAYLSRHTSTHHFFPLIACRNWRNHCQHLKKKLKWIAKWKKIKRILRRDMMIRYNVYTKSKLLIMGILKSIWLSDFQRCKWFDKCNCAHLCNTSVDWLTQNYVHWNGYVPDWLRFRNEELILVVWLTEYFFLKQVLLDWFFDSKISLVRVVTMATK